MKRCSKCRNEKPVTDFYGDRRTPDGLKSQCKECHTRTNIDTRDPDRARDTNRDYMRRARRRDPEKFRKREREAARRRQTNAKTRARVELNNAVRRGEVAKPDACEWCGQSGALEGHHGDYSRPLSVVWLCTVCHGREHRGERATSIEVGDG